MNPKNVIEQITSCWFEYAHGRFNNAFENLTDCLLNCSQLELEELKNYLPLVQNLQHVIHLQRVSRDDPFLQRRFLLRNLPRERFQDLTQQKITRPDFSVIEQLTSRIHMIQSPVEWRIHAYAQLLYALSSFESASTTEEEQRIYLSFQTNSIEHILRLSHSLGAFDLAEVCDRLENILDGYEFSLDRTPLWFLEEGISKTKLINRRLFAIERLSEYAKWLEKLNTPIIPGDYAFDARQRRRSMVRKYIELIQTFVLRKEFSKADSCVAGMLEVLDDYLAEWCGVKWEGPGSSSCFIYHKGKINPFDASLDVDVRLYMFKMLYRTQHALLEENHPALSLLRAEIAQLDSDDAQDYFAVPRARIGKSTPQNYKLADVDEIIESSKKFNERMRDYVCERWKLASSCDPLVVRFTARGKNFIQFTYIESPSDYTDTLTPEAVSQLIDVVNGASGKVYCGIYNGSESSFIKLGRAVS